MASMESLLLYGLGSLWCSMMYLHVLWVTVLSGLGSGVEIVVSVYV